MPLQEQSLFEFGPFRLDAGERRLLQNGRPIPLTPKAFQTLLVLVQNQGRVVEKEELLRKVWPDTFVEEATLAQNVFTLRKQLGDDRSEAVYIETVPKRGYRFVAPVQPVAARAAIESPLSIKPVPLHERSLSRRRLWIIATILACALAASTFYIGRRMNAPPLHAMLLVLPVQNLTGNTDRSYLADGLTEEFIAQLGAMDPRRLGVIARTSSMAYKDTNKTVDQIGRELNVNYVLEASLREAGQRTRVTAQLISTSDQARLWSQDYDAPSGDLVAVEDEIGRAVASEIHLELQPQSRRRLALIRAENPASRDLYLQARYYWNLRTQDGLNKSLTLFYQAAEKDPTNARAYAGVADAYNLLLFYGYSPGAGSILRAKEAAQKAVELDDALAEGHAALAYVEFMWLWEWPQAEKEFRRAISLNPNYVSGHQWFALYLSAMGRPQEAMAQINEARSLDPASLIVRAAAGLTAYYARNYDAAIAEAQAALDVNPNFTPALTVRGRAHEQKKMFPEAMADYQKEMELTQGTATTMLADLGHLYAVTGKTAEATAVIQKLSDLRRQFPFVGFTAEALVYAGMNDRDNAIAYLIKAEQQNDGARIWVSSDPRWDPVRSDPRFDAVAPVPSRTP